jgi:hypothetical protein
LRWELPRSPDRFGTKSAPCTHPACITGRSAVRDRYLRIAQYYRELADTEPVGLRVAKSANSIEGRADRGAPGEIGAGCPCDLLVDLVEPFAIAHIITGAGFAPVM